MARLFICLTLLAALAPGALPEAPSPFATPVPASEGPTAEPRADPAVSEEPAVDEPPEGYYAFVESPNATPPRVRGPPYRQVATDCAGTGPAAAGVEARPHVTANNLCGDLNRGLIPRNPMGQNPSGEPYPFELIRNHTLRFLSRTLPVLRADDTLPRVAHLSSPPRPVSSIETHNQLEERSKRSLELDTSPESRDSDSVPSHQLKAEHRSADGADTPRESRKFCDGGGV